MTKIPSELVEMLRERRVIPFLGAGFSAALGLPGWDALLRQVASEVQNAIPYDKVKHYCQGDFLQIAEYYFLKSDRNIGPLRHHISNLLQPAVHPITSTAHVELVNLNAQQIYTTNYDELIEKTFRQLGQPFSFVALPKDIAVADRAKPQVVKYHGDLRYDTTLVLTESSYYKRLEFESPMDLKFRSDLLGRSVLFIGYSFKDINIRIIWFKLMEMMKDVPESDRPSSFIVRFEKNEVLEDLYKAVGIKTICLDPDDKVKDSNGRNQLLGQFRLDLSLAVSDDAKMPVTKQQMYLSTGLLDAVTNGISKRGGRFAIARLRDPIALYLANAAARKIAPDLAATVGKFLSEIPRDYHHPELVNLAVNYLAHLFDPAPAARVIVNSLLYASTRDVALNIPTALWATIWHSLPMDLEFYSKKVYSELLHHSDFEPDHDLAFAVYLLKRQMIAHAAELPSPSLIKAATEIVEQVAAKYPSTQEINVSGDGPPELANVLEEISESMPSDDDDGPF